MAMAGWQREAMKIVRNFLSPISSRAHHNLAQVPQHYPSIGISVPRFLSHPEHVLDARGVDHSEDSNMLHRNPGMNLMAVPKRKVTPSRKGKRNGPKAYKPVTVIAKCKICGRVKLPHLYCCSGEIKS